jgi:hypothetical protein
MTPIAPAEATEARLAAAMAPDRFAGLRRSRQFDLAGITTGNAGVPAGCTS